METTPIDLFIELEDMNLNPVHSFADQDIPEITVDFSLPVESRLQAIELYYQRFGLATVEILKRILSLYIVSCSVDIERYITLICLRTNISIILRVELVKDLCSVSDPGKIDCFLTLNDLLGMACSSKYEFERLDEPNESEQRKRIIQSSALPNPLFYSAICVLMNSGIEDLRASTVEYFSLLLKNESTDEKYRYKLITSLKVHVTIPKELEFFELQSLKTFILDRNTSFMFRILAGQLYFQKSKDDRISMVFLDIAEDESVPYNARADATDLLLTYGSEDVKNHALALIKHLGKIAPGMDKTTGDHNFTIFQDGQNAHNNTIEESALNILLMLSQERIAKQPDNPELDIDYAFAEGEIRKSLFLETQSTTETVELALSRISLDNKLYSNLNFTLKNTLVFVYSYILIQDDQTKGDLMQRLIQELSDSAGICSTGIMERIINSLSGFEDRFSLRISFEDQIIGSLTGRLNSKIQKITSLPCLHKNNPKFCDCHMSACYASRCLIGDSTEKFKVEKCTKCVSCLGVRCTHACSDLSSECSFNSDYMNLILEEMLISTDEYSRRGNFLLFFRTYISEIMEDIRNDYKDVLDVASFDLYFRKAVMTYEGEL
jgi:hypothetical protein